MAEVIVSAAVRVDMDWGEFKAELAAKALAMQRAETDNRWKVWAVDGQTVYTAQAYKAGAEPVGWTPQQVTDNASDLAEIQAHEAGKVQATVSMNKLSVGARDSDVDGCTTPKITSGWARASFSLCCNSYLGAAYSKSWKCIPGDYGQTVLIHPGGCHLLDTSVAADAATFVVPDSELIPGVPIVAVFAAILAKGGYVEFWAGAGDTDDLLCRAKIVSVVGFTVTVEKALPAMTAGVVQVVSVLRGYSPVRGEYGLEGGAPFVGDNDEKIGNELECSSEVPSGLEIGIRLRAIGARTEESALSVSCMLRGPEA